MFMIHEFQLQGRIQPLSESNPSLSKAELGEFYREYNSKMAQFPPPTSPPSQEFLMSVFQSVDKDRSGFISVEELQRALSNGTWNPFNPETVRLMIGMFDKQNRGSVSFNDFAALWKYVTDWQACFRSFDQDNSGTINKNELLTALKTFGYNLSDATVQTIMTKFDRNRNNSILFDDFIQCCVLLNLVTTSFRQLDTDQDGVITVHYDQFLNMVLGIKL